MAHEKHRGREGIVVNLPHLRRRRLTGIGQGANLELETAARKAAMQNDRRNVES